MFAIYKALVKVIALAMVLTTFSCLVGATETKDGVDPQSKASSKSFEAGYWQRAAEIRLAIESRAAAFDKVYDFAKLAADGQLPPVAQPSQGNATQRQPCGDRGVCIIAQPARAYCQDGTTTANCKPVQWRDFLIDGLTGDVVESTETKTADFERGISEADRRMDRNLNQLKETYAGMLRYLQMQALLTAK